MTNSSEIFLLMKAKTLGVSLEKTVLMYCLYNFTYALLSPVLGKLSDKVGRKKLLVSGLFVFSAVYVGFSFASSEPILWVLFFIYGSYMAATDGAGKAYAVDLMPTQLKATGLGLLGSATGIAALIASTSAGLLWEKVSPASALMLGAVGALVAACLLLGISKRTSENT